jgi:hypothetical protein
MLPTLRSVTPNSDKQLEWRRLPLILLIPSDQCRAPNHPQEEPEYSCSMTSEEGAWMTPTPGMNTGDQVMRCAKV